MSLDFEPLISHPVCVNVVTFPFLEARETTEPESVAVCGGRWLCRWAEPRPWPENGRTGDKPIRGFVPPCYVIVMNIFTFKSM